MNADEYAVIRRGSLPPVRIAKAAWPVIASAKDWSGEFEFQADRSWRVAVRQHTDGRALIYGRYDTRWQGEADIHEGLLLESGSDIPGAIVAVCEAIGAPERLARACMDDLPAEDLK